MIEIKKVSKEFEKNIDKNKKIKFYADKDISFEVKDGEILGYAYASAMLCIVKRRLLFCFAWVKRMRSLRLSRRSALLKSFFASYRGSSKTNAEMLSQAERCSCTLVQA